MEGNFSTDGVGDGSGGDASDGERWGAMGSDGERWGAMGSDGKQKVKLHSLARSPPAVQPGFLTGLGLVPEGWGPLFYGFRQTYKDMYPSLWYHTEYFSLL